MGRPTDWFIRVRKPDRSGRHTHSAEAQRVHLDGPAKIHAFASADDREQLLELIDLLE